MATDNYDYIVGMTGFEPATPPPPRGVRYRAAPHSEDVISLQICDKYH